MRLVLPLRAEKVTGRKRWIIFDAENTEICIAESESAADSLIQLNGLQRRVEELERELKAGEVEVLDWQDEHHSMQENAKFWRLRCINLRREDAALTARLAACQEALKAAPTGSTGETHGDVIARYYQWYEGIRAKALAQKEKT